MPIFSKQINRRRERNKRILKSFLPEGLTYEEFVKKSNDQKQDLTILHNQHSQVTEEKVNNSLGQENSKVINPNSERIHFKSELLDELKTDFKYYEQIRSSINSGKKLDLDSFFSNSQQDLFSALPQMNQEIKSFSPHSEFENLHCLKIKKKDNINYLLAKYYDFEQQIKINTSGVMTDCNFEKLKREIKQNFSLRVRKPDIQKNNYKSLKGFETGFEFRNLHLKKVINKYQQFKKKLIDLKKKPLPHLVTKIIKN